MSLDLVGALKAPWRKDCGFARLFLGGLCTIVPFLAFVPMGYLAEYLNKMTNGKDELGNIFQHGGKSFVIGGKMFLGFVLLLIPYILLHLLLMLTLAQSPFLYTGVSSLISIAWYFVAISMILCFSVDFKILSAVNFESAICIFKESPSRFLVTVFLVFVVNIANTILLIILYFLGVFGFGFFAVIGVPIVSVISAIIGLVITLSIMFAICVSMYNILGQFARESQYIQSIKQDLV